jgi:hypothetical protein
MDLRELVRALLEHDALAAREWVAEAARRRTEWAEVKRPEDLDPTELAVAAGIVEVLADRARQQPPTWSSSVPAAPEPVVLVLAATQMKRLRRLCEEEGPEPLRRRNVLAPPSFLTAA